MPQISSLLNHSHANDFGVTCRSVTREPPPQPLGRAIGKTHRVVRAWGDRCLAPLDATVTDWILLHHIAQAEAPGLSQTDVARFADMGGPALVRHVDRLEAEGILQRRRDQDDRRVVRLTLTPAGEARRAALGEVMEDCDRRLRDQLDDRETRALERALDTLFTFAQGELEREDTP